VSFAGRAYAAYGGVYIVACLVWLWIVEGTQPDGWDLSGASFCLIGAAIILFEPQTHLISSPKINYLEQYPSIPLR